MKYILSPARYFLLMVAGLFIAVMPASAIVPPAPTVSGITPTTAAQDTNTTFSATYSSVATLTSCQLVLDGGTSFAMATSGTATAGTATYGYTFSAPGSHTMQAQCLDDYGNWGYGAVTTINVPTPGTIGAVTPTTAFANVATTFSAPYSGFNLPFKVSGCWLVVDGSTVYPGMSVGGDNINGTASKDYTFSAAGSHSMFVSCLEANGGTYRHSPTATITVTADTSNPTVGGVTPAAATAGSAVMLNASFSDTGTGVVSCDFKEGATTLASQTFTPANLGGIAGVSYTFSAAGTHNVNAQCRDAAGNLGVGPTTGISVSAATVADTVPPSVGQIAQTTAVTGVSTGLSASVSDNVGVTQCDLYVNGTDQGTMTLSGGIASRAYTFGSAGTFSAYALCRDAAANIGTGAARTVVVGSATPPPGLPAYGSLVKLACPAGAGVNDPCKAVYYFGSDNRRHAFPNEKVYFTWYSDFSGVMTVSNSVMATMTLGSNVVYRPGVRMVKFTTVPRVYAVSGHGVLRWVSTEAIAIALYGTNWNHNIDDINDAFYTNYTFGADINAVGDFNPTATAAAALTIDSNL